MSRLDDLITHPRERWQSSSFPVQSSNLFEYDDVNVVVAHYTAAVNLPDGDLGEHVNDLFQYLRNIQHFYVTQRGYSIGYNLAIDWLGGVWELRGDTYECAANSGANHRAFAVLCLVDGDDRLTDAAAASFRKIVARVRRESPLAVSVSGHSLLPETTSGTPCPGLGIKRDLAEGRLDPALFEPAPTPPPPAPVWDPVNGEYGWWPVKDKWDIDIGDTGRIVKYLQGVLKNEARTLIPKARIAKLTSVEINGTFDTATGEAVKYVKELKGWGHIKTVVGKPFWKIIDEAAV